MSRVGLILGILAVAAGLWVRGATPSLPTLTDLRKIHSLTNAEADRGYPVAFEASVTYYRKGNVDLFVQDGDTAIYVETSSGEDLATGDRVLIRGATRGSFRPEIKASQIVVLHHGAPPTPIPASFGQLIRAEFDCRRVTIRAKVRSANTVLDVGSKSTYLNLLMDGGAVDAEVFGSVSRQLSGLLDAEVEVTGAVAGKFDSKMEMTGILLQVPSLTDLKVVLPPERAPETLAITPMDEILHAINVEDRTQRVRVEGSVTYYQPGSAVVVQDGTRSLWLKTDYEEPLRVGEWISSSGFPDVENGFLTLAHSAIEPKGRLAPIAPYTGSAAELARGLHASELVSVEGRLITAIRDASQDEYLLVSGDHLFSAVYRHPGRGLGLALPGLKQLPLGARVRVTGICMLDRGDLYQGIVPFNILLRSQDDLVEVSRPPLLNVRHLVELVALLLVMILGIGARAWVTERKLRNRAAQMVVVEQMRSDVLARINRAHPLPEVLGQITRLVTAALPAAYCWCEMEGCDPVGEAPPDDTRLRRVQNVIAARSGPPYGMMWAAFASSKPEPSEAGILSTASELVTIAIETSRTHSDLVLRSEFDLLTGLNNRFALERHLEAVVERQKTHEGVLALIYLDLDGFKQINDSYGHHVGDLYLREAATRMKHQIRPTDRMARLGGDEFAVVVYGARARSDVEDIVNRLERCFDQRFELNGLMIEGSASFGVAYHPEDGTTRETLLQSADAAMYQRKRSRRDAVWILGASGDVRQGK